MKCREEFHNNNIRYYGGETTGIAETSKGS